jgi:hypothetical protein
MVENVGVAPASALPDGAGYHTVVTFSGALGRFVPSEGNDEAYLDASAWGLLGRKRSADE